MNKKILIASLFVCILIVCSIVSAVDINTYKNRISKNDSLDTYKEIFTRIDGLCDKIDKKGIGLFIHLNVEMWASTLHGWGLTIKGIRQPFESFEIEVDYIKVPLLIGLIGAGLNPEIHGFAFGNIEWD